MFRRMSKNDEQALEQLSGYCNSLVSGETFTVAQPQLGRELAATVGQIHEWDAPAPVDDKFASDLLEQLVGIAGGVDAGVDSSRDTTSTSSNVVSGKWPVPPSSPECRTVATSETPNAVSNGCCRRHHCGTCDYRGCHDLDRV
ncbi:hypothetical protein BH23CHL5_BH23CHL5_21860 [soil metagenome]